MAAANGQILPLDQQQRERTDPHTGHQEQLPALVRVYREMQLSVAIGPCCRMIHLQMNVISACM